MIYIHIDLLLRSSKQSGIRLSPTERIVGIQEELSGFLLDHVIHPKGVFHLVSIRQVVYM
jgi:hypothetical protein